jgi:hypothetical protein
MNATAIEAADVDLLYFIKELTVFKYLIMVKRVHCMFFKNGFFNRLVASILLLANRLESGLAQKIEAMLTLFELENNTLYFDAVVSRHGSHPNATVVPVKK